ncbi:hypothetical protein HHK36_031370 [Tetracentron sinense]|uniref:Nuclease HARBI1 n=1 Tax=Tetracentron sinense TaxID=13715 RepID=A0A835D1N4_TETSI|nr:hypothetical protein HHK36_031370 [Tetracentron sinense]
MDHNLLNNMFCGDFEDSDKELEILTIACMEEERLNKEKQWRRHRGSVQGHRVIWRDRVQGHERLFHDYFAETPVNPLILFRRRFRMQRSLFLRIQYAVEAHNPYFVQKTDTLGMLSLSSLQKIITAMRMLAYEVAADYVDEYVRIGESTAIESLKKFVQAVVSIFFDEYLRPSNNDDTARLLAVGENRGFPGIIVRLQRSSAFTNLADGHAAAINYSVNGNDYAMGYYLADAQESARKDVERAFGVLQARFAIVRGPACFWKCETLKDIRKACILMHNMIVEDERDVNGAEDFNYDAIDDSPHAPVSHERTTELMEFIRGTRCIRDRGTHFQLQSDLFKQLWQRHGQL